MDDRESTPQEKYEFLDAYYKERVKPCIEKGDPTSLREARRGMQRIYIGLRLVPSHVVPYASGQNLIIDAEDLANALCRDGITEELLEESVRSFEAHLAQWGLAVKSGNILGLDSVSSW